MIDIFQKLSGLISRNNPAVLVTITGVKGSSPGKTGFKMLAGPSGLIAGTVGGGSVEFHAVEKSKELLKSDENFFTETLYMNGTILSTEKEVSDSQHLNSLCGGEVTLFYEVYRQAKPVYIFGAGHVGRALARLAREAGFFVSVFDTREDIIHEFPSEAADIKSVYDFSILPDGADRDFLSLKPEGFAVIVTHNHMFDLQVLEYLLTNYPDMKYIGMIGSSRKVKENIIYLKKKYGGRVSFDKLYSPIGLNLGGSTPGEIALCILAEIQSVSYGRQANHLRLNYDEL